MPPTPHRASNCAKVAHTPACRKKRVVKNHWILARWGGECSNLPFFMLRRKERVNGYVVRKCDEDGKLELKHTVGAM